jgi:hypothetical protein
MENESRTFTEIGMHNAFKTMGIASRILTNFSERRLRSVEKSVGQLAARKVNRIISRRVFA